MASEQPFSGDLRSAAKEFKREKEHKAKWALGGGHGPGNRLEDHPRPVRFKKCPDGIRNYGKHPQKTRSANDAYAGVRNASDSSADECVEEPDTAFPGAADVTYSFDAERGPSSGSQVLGQALEKAIERYEVRVTDKLIKEEYEVLDTKQEALSPGPEVREDEGYIFVMD